MTSRIVVPTLAHVPSINQSLGPFWVASCESRVNNVRNNSPTGSFPTTVQPCRSPRHPRRKSLEIKPRKAQNRSMDRDHTEAPAYWVEELARADEDIAQGNIVPAHVVHEELRTAIAELEAEIAAQAEAPVAKPLRR
jgi:hypothetical protein